MDESTNLSAVGVVVIHVCMCVCTISFPLLLRRPSALPLFRRKTLLITELLDFELAPGFPLPDLNSILSDFDGIPHINTVFVNLTAAYHGAAFLF